MNHRTNNFDSLRLLGALLVAVSHSATIVLNSEPLGDATGNQTLGGVGLNLFCVISGFLITKSRLTNPAQRFFRSRALRIFPALIVAIPLMALVLGPIFSSLSPKEYFRNAETWQFLATMLVFPLNPSLPGVFGNSLLVGQLYSLTAELGFYILVGLLAPWRHFGKFMILATAGVLAFFMLNDYITLPFSDIFSLEFAGTTLVFFPLRLGMTCVYYLFAGCLIALFVNRPERLARLAPALAVAWIAALFLLNRQHYDLVEMLVFPALVIGAALSMKLHVRIPKQMGDTSYGIYIYHFFIAEAVLTLCAASIGRNWSLIAIAIALSVVAAWFSFRYVEAPALAIKDDRKHRAGLHEPTRPETGPISRPDTEHFGQRRYTQREQFLAEMEATVPWAALVALIEPFRAKSNAPYSLESMLRIHLLQNWFSLNSTAAEDALREISSLHKFAKLPPGGGSIPEEMEITHFHELLERHGIAACILAIVKGHLDRKGLSLIHGSIIDATIVPQLNNSMSQADTRVL